MAGKKEMKPLAIASPYIESILIVLAMAGMLLVTKSYPREGPRYTLLLIGVIYGAWRGGKGPSIAALVLSCFLAAYVFSQPVNTWKIGSHADQLTFFRYVIVGLAVTIFGEAQHLILRRLRAKEKELTEAYRQLEEANQKLKALAERHETDLKELRRFVADEI